MKRCIITLAEKIAETEARRARYILAETALLSGGQAYSIGNRSLTRADLEEIRKTIDKLAGDIVTLQRGNQIVSQRVVPRDF